MNRRVCLYAIGIDDCVKDVLEPKRDDVPPVGRLAECCCAHGWRSALYFHGGGNRLVQPGGEHTLTAAHFLTCAEVAPEEKQLVAEGFFAKDFKSLSPYVAR